MKKTISILLCTIMIFSSVYAIPAYAKTNNDVITLSTLTASKKTLNKKAKKQYKKNIAKIKKKAADRDSYCFKYADLTGDGVVELIAYYYTGKIGSGRNFEIYTYKKGKSKCILKDCTYGLNKLIAYTKIKSFVIKCSGHGGENNEYYKYNGKKFVWVAGCGRQSPKGGSESYSDWYYRVEGINEETDGEATVTDFNSAVKPLTAGKKKVIKF